jgi:micrococcal nuclease
MALPKRLASVSEDEPVMSVFRTASLVIVTILAVLQPAMSAYAEDIPTEPAYLYRAVVVRVVDGDTIDVDIDLGFYVWIRKQRIRLLGIDAPKQKGETRPEGLAATEHLQSLIEGERIILRTVKGDDGGDRDDSFGRWLGTIYHGDIDVNAETLGVRQTLRRSVTLGHCT